MPGAEELALRLSALEARLRELEDVEAIKDLKARYGELVDRRYARGEPLAGEALGALAGEIAALFTADAVWDGGPGLGLARGREEIRQRMREPTLRFSWHYFLKPRIRIEGDRARGRWDLLAPCTTRDGRPHWMAGFEDDEYQRVDGAWLHRRMELSVVFLAPHATGWERILR